MILKLIWKCKGFRTVKTILKKNYKVGGIPFPDFKIYYTVNLIKTVWSGIVTNISISGIELRVQKLTVTFMIYGQLIFHKVVKTIQ